MENNGCNALRTLFSFDARREASVATGARPGSAKHEHGGLATARQQGDGVTFAFFLQKA